jgi:large subunit ribosomal protein L4
MPDLAVMDNHGKEVEKIELPDAIFDGKVNKALLHQIVVAYERNLRQGNAATKTRGEISGGGKKPWKQKGTGRARAGSSRSPLWRHGGVVFGPHPRDFSVQIPQKVKLAALKSGLNDKLNSGSIKIIDSINMEKPKTKEFMNLLTKLKIKEDTLAVLDAKDKNAILSSRNISFLSLKQANDINAYDVLRHKNILITKSGLKILIKRIKV